MPSYCIEDDWTIIDSNADDNHNGNFHALLQFRLDAENHTLKQHQLVMPLHIPAKVYKMI